MSQPRFTDKKLVNNKPKNIKKYKLMISLKINNKQATLTTDSNKQFAEHLRLWKCCDEQNKRNEYGRNCAGAGEINKYG